MQKLYLFILFTEFFYTMLSVKKFKDGGKSPYLKKLKTIIHPGEVRNRPALHISGIGFFMICFELC